MDNDGRLVLLSAVDGRQLRVLAEVYGPRPHVDATPDGRTLYFSPTIDQDPGPGCEPPVVESVSVDGGDRKRVDRGSSPIVSPDGRRLAYLQTDASSCEQSHIVMRELDDDAVRRWPVAAGVGVTLMSWSPDSRHVTVVSDDDEDGAGDLLNQWLDTERGGSLADADRITTRDSGPAVLGELGATDTLAADTGNLTAIDRETGAELRTLYDFTATPDLPRPMYDDRRFDSDPSGRHLLWIGSWVRSNVLVRYSEGDPAPTELGEGFEHATWLPGSG
jgi:hypothetical protein